MMDKELRIEWEGGRLILTQSGSTPEIRVVKPGIPARIAAWWRARRGKAMLEELDARTLKDIGLESHAARVEERRRLEARLSSLLKL
jgi:uncharacterized protein YjiS (DUF1127 family)